MQTSTVNHDARGGSSRGWRIALAAVLCAVWLAGCGGSDAPEESTTTPPPTTSPPTTPPPTTPPPTTPPPTTPPGGGTPGSFALYPAKLGLTPTTSARLTTLRAPGTVLWSSSVPAVASVDAEGNVTALSPGSTVITATSGASVASTTLKVYRTEGANADATAESLIAQALALGRISAEQALIYRVFALFGDERLPVEFEGAPSATPSHGLLRELASTVHMLTPATQEVLRPFLLPPMYAQSWWAQRLGLAAPAAKALNAGRTSPLLTTTNCEASRLPDFFPRVSTAHFNIFYMKQLDPVQDAVSAQVVAMIASMIEEVYQTETTLLGRFPLADTLEDCNGGDGAVDIYYGSFALFGTGAWTHTYALAPDQRDRNACLSRPSYIMLNKQSLEFLAIERSLAQGRPLAKSILAHELLHVLQFAMARPASCDDTLWIDEATAQWAMDHVVPTIPQGDPGEFGAEPGLGRVAPNLPKSGPGLAEYLYSGHMVSIEKPGELPALNGYSDYLFFQFLARQYGPDKIKQIFDAMVGGKNSVEAIAVAVDMKTVWPEFASSLWIGVEDHVLDFWNAEDQYRFGLADVYAQTPTVGIPARLKDKLKTLQVDQRGQSRAKFELLKNALAPEGYLIQPRSLFYEHLKFSDPTVHSVYITNPIAVFPNNEFMKVQAIKKIGGEWKAREDWTRESFKQFCLDKKDERLQELILIVSNSEASRATERPFTIPTFVPMQVSTSNVGCWKWQGTASSMLNGGSPASIDSLASGAVTLEVSGVLPGRLVFETSAGVISARSTAVLGDGCTVTAVGSDKNAVKGSVPPEGTIDLNLDFDLGFGGIGGEPPDRKLIVLSGSSRLSTRTTLVCGPVTQTSVGDQGWDWLRVDEPGLYKVSADGQSIEGRFSSLVPGGATITTLWKFNAVRE